MGAASSVNTTPDVPEDGLDIDVPTFKKLRKLYEAKKNGESPSRSNTIYQCPSHQLSYKKITLA
jgi:hypothetical protein